MKRRWTWVALGAAALGLTACSTGGSRPIDTVPKVDLNRFMGDWYVIANIPPFIEKGAHNSIENYRLDADGTIPTTFTYRADSFDGPAKKLTSRAFVLDKQSNAVWGVQFIWPIKADYRVTYLAPGYDQTIVSRENRDWVWIMARTPAISESDYVRLSAIVAKQGYDIDRLQKVPQKWN